MHVAIDARLVHYTAGGIARYSLELASALPSVAPEDRFTLLRSVRQRHALPSRPNLSSAPILTPPHHRWEQVSLPFEVGRLRPDLLHSTDFVPPFRRWYPAVVTVHELGFLRFPETLTAASLRYYRQVGKAVTNAQRTIAVSHHTARDLADLAHVPLDRVRVVYNGVSPQFQPVEDAAALDRLRTRYRLDRPYVLFVGTLEPRKNVSTLLRAFQAVRAREDVLLVLAGRRGWLFEPIFHLVDELQLNDHVRILERVALDELPVIYTAAAALSLPSLYEGFGLTALEAMACGVPTVVADTSALPEVVGDAALLHPPTEEEALADALLRLLQDEDLRATLRKRGQERAARFTWDETARQTLAVYREALG